MRAAMSVLAAAAMLFPHPAPAQQPPASSASATATDLDRVIVLGRRDNLLGQAVSASEGSVSREEMERRPRLRPGDLAEFVPGVAATQHSGSGKANQYFLRGFNLDHGTDFAQFVEGMPVNLRSHGHGQGYSDLNFLIPELVDSLTFRKGPYYADVGDFSAAGTARYQLVDGMQAGLLQLEAGSHGYARAVAANSAPLGAAALTWGLEAQQYDGDWSDIDENVRKYNGMLRLSGQLWGGRGQVLAMAYDNRWNSPDQIPERAVRSGVIDEFGSIDTTLGGDSSRRSLSASWDGDVAGGDFSASAYWIDYELSLWSNFTYFLDDPVDGDQFRQFDERDLAGFDLRQAWKGERWQARAGVEGRRDDIAHVGLSRTRDRAFVAAVRDDAVDESSLGLWADAEWRFTPELRAGMGARHDAYDFDVRALQPENSGETEDGLTSFKAHAAWRAVDPLELYASWGQGLHSNDARGTTIAVDPVTGDTADRVTPLVRSTGSELGMRWFEADRVSATLALWQLDIDSELLFVGDAGNTESTRPSAREGVEATFYWLAHPMARIELEAAYTRARFDDHDPAGDYIPGAVPLVTSAAWSADWGRGWYSSLRVRHLGAYPLIEDNSVRSDGSTLVNLAVGTRWDGWGLELDVLNLLDSDDHDIDYFYASRLPGEPDGVADVHFHVFVPRSFRIRLTRAF